MSSKNWLHLDRGLAYRRQVSYMRNIGTRLAMSTRAAAQIRSAILNGKLAPAARIRQEDLAERLGVSRQPVRHALLMVERKCLVRIVPKHGSIVAPVERKLILEFYDLREAVEPYVASLLARDKTDSNPQGCSKSSSKAAKRWHPTDSPASLSWTSSFITRCTRPQAIRSLPT